MHEKELQDIEDAKNGIATYKTHLHTLLGVLSLSFAYDSFDKPWYCSLIAIVFIVSLGLWLIRATRLTEQLKKLTGMKFTLNSQVGGKFDHEIYKEVFEVQRRLADPLKNIPFLIGFLSLVAVFVKAIIS